MIFVCAAVSKVPFKVVASTLPNEPVDVKLLDIFPEEVNAVNICSEPDIIPLGN